MSSFPDDVYKGFSRTVVVELGLRTPFVLLNIPEDCQRPSACVGSVQPCAGKCLNNRLRAEDAVDVVFADFCGFLPSPPP